jgi:Flp pilus assembly protein TadB
VRGLPGPAQRVADIGSSLPGIVMITFIALKLTGVVGWSWWWVLSPIWIGGILFVLGLCALFVLLCMEARGRMRAFMDQLKSGDWRSRPG